MSDNLSDVPFVPSADLRESRRHLDQRFLNLNHTYTSRNVSCQSGGHHRHLSIENANCLPPSLWPHVQHVHWDVAHTFQTRAYIARHSRCEHKKRQRCEHKKKRSQCQCEGYDEHSDVFSSVILHTSLRRRQQTFATSDVFLYTAAKRS